MPDDFFSPFLSGDRPQPAPLLPTASDAVLLYLGAGLDLYPVAARYAKFSTFLYVDAKPRLTRAPGHQDHASWRAPADVARAVIERSGNNLDRDGWELVAPEVLKFRGRDGITLYYIFATLDFELASRVSTTPVVAQLLQRVEALYVHGLYISPETNLHLPSLRTVYAIPGNATCADVDFIAEHNCTPPLPSSLYYIPTHAEREHYEKLCAWAGVRVDEDGVMSSTGIMGELGERSRVGGKDRKGDRVGRGDLTGERLEHVLQVERQLQNFIGLTPAAAIQAPKSKPKPPKSKSRHSPQAQSERTPLGQPLRFVLIDQISWDDDLPYGTLPPPPTPSLTGVYEHPSPPSLLSVSTSRSMRPSAESTSSLPVRKQSIPHVLPPLPFSSSPSLPLELVQSTKRLSRPRTGGGAAQGLVWSSSSSFRSRPLGSSHPSSPGVARGRAALEEEVRPLRTGGYKVAKTIKEAEVVWIERERKERERLREEKSMRERVGMSASTQPRPKPRGFFKFFASGFLERDPTDRRYLHAHTV